MRKSVETPSLLRYQLKEQGSIRLSFDPTEPEHANVHSSSSAVAGSRNLSVGWCSLAVGAALGFDFSWTVNSAKHIPFDWKGP